VNLKNGKVEELNNNIFVIYKGNISYKFIGENEIDKMEWVNII